MLKKGHNMDTVKIIRTQIQRNVTMRIKSTSAEIEILFLN
jgi:hypothetical protein